MGFYWRRSDQLIAADPDRCALAGDMSLQFWVLGLIDADDRRWIGGEDRQT